MKYAKTTASVACMPVGENGAKLVRTVTRIRSGYESAPLRSTGAEMSASFRVNYTIKKYSECPDALKATTLGR